jgi:hypothetical protein
MLLHSLPLFLAMHRGEDFCRYSVKKQQQGEWAGLAFVNEGPEHFLEFVSEGIVMGGFAHGLRSRNAVFQPSFQILLHISAHFLASMRV